MRVLLLPDPVLAGQAGGLRTQVLETLAALGMVGGPGGIEAELAPPGGACLAGWDVVHGFGAGSGVAAALEEASANGAAVVLSPRVSTAWSRSNGTRARLADASCGRGAEGMLESSYARLRRALRLARTVVAHSAAERDVMCDTFLLAPGRVEIVPHGVAVRFFDADPGPFRARVRINGRFALMAGRIAPDNRQLAVARALAELALPLVVVGDARERDASYLRELRSMRTVVCVDALAHDDPMLASAYAAAALLVRAGPGAGESMAVAEALAAGTPVVNPLGAGLPAEAGRTAVVCCGDDAAALQCAVSDLLERAPARESVCATQTCTSWEAVARALVETYRRAVAQGAAARA
jgi:glycosyltransferase involved in cell wall biosynthesis